MITDTDRADTDGPDEGEERCPGSRTETGSEDSPERPESGAVSTDSHRTDNGSDHAREGDPDEAAGLRNDREYPPAASRRNSARHVGRRHRFVELVLRRFSRHARSLARNEQGLARAIRVGALLATACVVSNLVGAAVVFVIAGPVRASPPDVEHPTAQLLRNLSLLGGYLVLAIGLGAVWSVRLVIPVLSWLLTEKEPDADQQRYALRFPLTQAKVFASFWALAIPLFVAFNAFVSWRLALGVGLTVVLGGLTTIAVGYLIVERIWRPVSAAALRTGVPARPALPGVASARC